MANPFAAANPFAPKPAAANPFAPAANPFAPAAAANPFAPAPAANPFAPAPAAAPAANLWGNFGQAAAAPQAQAAVAPAAPPDPTQQPIENGLLAIDYFRTQLSTPIQFALYNILSKYLRKDRDNYGFKRVVYDQRTPEPRPIPALMSRDEFEKELRENDQDDSFDPPIPLVPAVMDGFKGCLARIAMQKETAEKATTAAKALADKAKLLEQDFLAAKAAVEKLRTRQAELRAKLLRIAAKLEQLSASSSSSSSGGGLSAGALQHGLEGAAARRCVLALRRYLLQESQLRERIDQLLLIQRMHSDAAAYAAASSSSSSSALALGLGSGAGAMVRTMGGSASSSSSSAGSSSGEDPEDLRLLMRQLSLHGKGIEQVLAIVRRDVAHLGVMEGKLEAAKRLVDSERERSRGAVTGGGGFGYGGFGATAGGGWGQGGY